jgi:hypothetical protein
MSIASVFNNPCKDDSCPIMHNIFATPNEKTEAELLDADDYSQDELGCYSSSDGDFVPNKLGIYLLLLSYFLSLAWFIMGTLISYYRQGMISNKNFYKLRLN